MARWLERLSDFDFEVEHSQGQLHGDADGLSRLPFDEDASVKDTRYATLIQSVNMELVKGQSTCDSEPRSCSSASVKWLKTGVRPLRGDVDGGRGEHKLLFYWSQLGKRAKTPILI